MQEPTEGPREASSTSVEPAEILASLRWLARPRMTGSAEADEVASELRRRFQDLGYSVRELAFSFSTLPGRYGLPTAGVVLMAVAGIVGWILPDGRATSAVIVLVAGLLLAVLPLLLLDASLRRLPWGRVRTSNLLFTRDRPRWIIMAHRDTKSQLAPTLVRTIALVTATLGWAGLVVVAVSGLAGTPPSAGAVRVAAGTLFAAGAVLGLSPAGNASPGALDNGTGLAALLALAMRVDPTVAFLVTDGEELGLAGARAVADRLPRVTGIINLDGLDDAGPIRIAEGRAGGRSEAAGAVGLALLEEARRLGLDVVRRPLPPFVLVDHEPLAAAGLPALSVLKGRWRSLLRLHRPADTADRLTGTGAAEVVTLVLATLGRPDDEAGDTLRSDERSGHSPAP